MTNPGDLYQFSALFIRYIYEIDVGNDMPSYKDYKYGVEYMFISLLAKSKFRTKVSCVPIIIAKVLLCSSYKWLKLSSENFTL